MKNSKLDKKFWKYIEINDNGCWYWKGCTSSKGYGRFRAGEKVVLAHRYALLGIAEKSENRMVCHKCDHPACCNPNHLYLGTRIDNVADMLERNSDYSIIRRKLYPGEVWLIRKLYKNGISKRRIAPMFKVSWPTISRAVEHQKPYE